MPDGTIRYVGTQGNTVAESATQSSATTTTPTQTSNTAGQGVAVTIDDNTPSNTSTTRTTQNTSLLPFLITPASNAGSSQKRTSGISGMEIHWAGINTGIPAVDDAISTAIAIPVAAVQTVTGN